MATRVRIVRIVTLFALLCAPLLPGSASGHCDGLDGPVVGAARKALASGNVDLVLVWVQQADEKEVRDAFQQTLAVRKLGGDAQALADRFFFETLVRLHRRGEGAPYTGLVPAGRDLGPAIPLADQALAEGKVDRIAELIVGETRKGLVERFHRAKEARDYAPSDVRAGREYVDAYVTYIHYVERAHEAAVEPVAGHFPEPVHEAEHDAERSR
jgi:hypothetical protein